MTVATDWNLSPALRDLYREQSQLAEDADKFILAPRAKKRLAELPALIIRQHAAEEKLAQEEVDLQREFAERFERALEDYVAALKAAVEVKNAWDALCAEARANGIYAPKIEVLAHQDRDGLRALMIRARGTLLA